MNYYDMNKCLCKELCCEFEKFENEPRDTILKNVKDLIESMVGLTELEAAGAMREYLEDEHGYDSRSGQFMNRGWDRRYPVWNAAKHYPMNGYEYPPYYGGEYGMMDDGRYMNRGDGNDMRRDGEVYDRARSRDSRGRYNDGRMGIYNMAHKDGMMKKKLDDREKHEWVDSLVNEDGTVGPTFSKEESLAIAKKVGAKFDNYDETDFYVVLNSIYSDYCSALEKSHAGHDKIETYGYLALAWLEDDDSYPPEEKLARYYEYIVKH